MYMINKKNVIHSVLYRVLVRKLEDGYQPEVPFIDENTQLQRILKKYDR